MSKPVSTTVGIWWLSRAALNAYAQQNSAVSPEAQAVTRAASELANSAEDSRILFGEKAAAISQLRALENDCAGQGWDGDDACPLEPLAVQNAENFVRVLPEGLPLPEFAPEPDGSVSLDWIKSRHRLFSLSIGRTDRLAYAWLDGTDNGHGVARFDGLSVPPRVLSGIHSILNNGNLSIRPA